MELKKNKGGRPRKPADEKRTIGKYIYLTESEHKELVKFADEMNMSQSAIMRHATAEMMDLIRMGAVDAEYFKDKAST